MLRPVTRQPVVLAVVLLLGARGMSANAPGRHSFEFVHVDINILPNSDLEITETGKVVFTGGNFHYLYRWIPTDQLDAIDAVEVCEECHSYPADPAVKGWIDTRVKTGGPGRPEPGLHHL